LPALAQREIEEACAVEDDASAEVDTAGGLRLLPEDDLRLLEPRGAELRAHQLGANAAFAGARIGEIDDAVLAEARMQRDLQQPALPARRDTRHAFDVGAFEIRREQVQS